MPTKSEIKFARMALFRWCLFLAGIVCLGLSAYYLYQLIALGRWDDPNIRLPQLIQFFGGIGLIISSKILKNQQEILEILYRDRDRG